jgi:SAM-dependent methyltransferase
VTLPAATFESYARWYDAFNLGKDYGAECDYLRSLVETHGIDARRWLDVGCGTGGHVAALAAAGVDAVGADPSASMVAEARRRHPHLPIHHASAQSLRIEQRFDVVSMLFHVISYQLDDEAIIDGLRNIARHLDDAGLLVLDFWHSGGVRHDPPHRRVRTADVDGRRLLRIAVPSEDRSRRIVSVHFEFRWDVEDGELAGSETHRMRHFEVDELQVMLRAAQLRMTRCAGWSSHQPLAATQWYGVMCAAPERGQ